MAMHMHETETAVVARAINPGGLNLTSGFRPCARDIAISEPLTSKLSAELGKLCRLSEDRVVREKFDDRRTNLLHQLNSVVADCEKPGECICLNRGHTHRKSSSSGPARSFARSLIFNPHGLHMGVVERELGHRGCNADAKFRIEDHHFYFQRRERGELTTVVLAAKVGVVGDVACLISNQKKHRVSNTLRRNPQIPDDHCRKRALPEPKVGHRLSGNSTISSSCFPCPRQEDAQRNQRCENGSYGADPVWARFRGEFGPPAIKSNVFPATDIHVYNPAFSYADSIAFCFRRVSSTHSLRVNSSCA